VWKPERASGAAPRMEPLHLHLFGRAPGGAVVGAGAGALPNRALVSNKTCCGTVHFSILYAFLPLARQLVGFQMAKQNRLLHSKLYVVLSNQDSQLLVCI
jgi:hypothetical protein